MMISEDEVGLTFVATLAKHLLGLDLLVDQPERVDVTREITKGSLLTSITREK